MAKWTTSAENFIKDKDLPKIIFDQNSKPSVLRSMVQSVFLLNGLLVVIAVI